MISHTGLNRQEYSQGLETIIISKRLLSADPGTPEQWANESYGWQTWRGCRTGRIWMSGIFVAVKAGAAMSAPMHPWHCNGSILLVDRHYCSLVECRKGEPNLYLVRKGEALMVRWVELQGTQLSLRPENGNCPLDFVTIDRKNPLTACIVGRVAHIATELGGPLQRRPMLS